MKLLAYFLTQYVFNVLRNETIIIGKCVFKMFLTVQGVAGNHPREFCYCFLKLSSVPNMGLKLRRDQQSLY